MQNHEHLLIKQPSPTEIRTARAVAGLSQSAAAELVFAKLRVWQYWESDNAREINLASWELFLLKTDQHPNFKIQKKAG